jgi:hypothetical protein
MPGISGRSALQHTRIRGAGPARAQVEGTREGERVDRKTAARVIGHMVVAKQARNCLAARLLALPRLTGHCRDFVMTMPALHPDSMLACLQPAHLALRGPLNKVQWRA